MKLFGMNVGREKPVSFSEFREMVRLAARKAFPGAAMQNNENGFLLNINGRMEVCNLRGLYAGYCKSTSECDRMIRAYLNNLQVDNPIHSWQDAQPLLRPSIRSTSFLKAADSSLQRGQTPDSVPYVPFVGDLHVIAVVELNDRIWAVTQGALENWSVTMEEVMSLAYNNMSMLSFPAVESTFQSGTKGEGAAELGMIFSGNHLTATWLIMERFRDYVGQRLEGSYVVSVLNRARLTAVRSDEPGLIANIKNSARGFQNLPYPLTSQLYMVDMSLTGGSVTVYGDSKTALAQESIFQQTTLASVAQATQMEKQGRQFDNSLLSEPAIDPNDRGNSR